MANPRSRIIRPTDRSTMRCHEMAVSHSTAQCAMRRWTMDDGRRGAADGGRWVDDGSQMADRGRCDGRVSAEMGPPVPALASTKPRQAGARAAAEGR